MTDDKDVAFALRLPFNTKAAAFSLTNLETVYVRGEDGRISDVKVGSINEALNALITLGMRTLRKELEECEITRAQERFEKVRVMMEFLIQHPTVNQIRASDPPEGSAAQKMILEEPDEFSDEPAIRRVEVANEYAKYQERLDRLERTKGQIENALKPDPELPKTRKRLPPKHLWGAAPEVNSAAS